LPAGKRRSQRQQNSARYGERYVWNVGHKAAQAVLRLRNWWNSRSKKWMAARIRGRGSPRDACSRCSRHNRTARGRCRRHRSQVFAFRAITGARE
jgi:hypothetical protein